VSYLPDTNAWICYLRRKSPALVERFTRTNPADIPNFAVYRVWSWRIGSNAGVSETPYRATESLGKSRVEMVARNDTLD
jgi:hypothetical protein